MDKTSTSTGLKVFINIKNKVYVTARKASESFKKNISIIFDDYLGKWYYRAIPMTKESQVIF